MGIIGEKCLKIIIQYGWATSTIVTFLPLCKENNKYKL